MIEMKKTPCYWPFSLPSPPEYMYSTKKARRYGTFFGDVQYAYTSFKHVIKTDWHKTYENPEFFDWCMHNFCYWLVDRVSSTWDGRYVTDGIGGGDEVFICTNSDDAAVLAESIWTEMAFRFQKLNPTLGANRLLICDWRYYVQNELSIVEWANDCTPGMIRQGMLLQFDNESDISNFMLRWA